MTFLLFFCLGRETRLQLVPKIEDFDVRNRHPGSAHWVATSIKKERTSPAFDPHTRTTRPRRDFVHPPPLAVKELFRAALSEFRVVMAPVPVEPASELELPPPYGVKQK